MKPYISKLVALLFFLQIYQSHCQISPGFNIVTVQSFEYPTSFIANGPNIFFVTQKNGEVYRINGAAKSLILDLKNEVFMDGDLGLFTIVLDPNFGTNGYFYLYYIVDRNWYFNMNTPNYQIDKNEIGATFGRITRFTYSQTTQTADPNSRLVIFGETHNTGFPITNRTHGGGHLKFDDHGYLYLSLGDGTGWENFNEQGYQNGILNFDEYSVAEGWRSQLPNSHSGKILRLNPANGNGVSDNPFYNSATPRSPQSRTWVTGLRNTFSFMFMPEFLDTTHHHYPTIILGDVGHNDFEEINIADAPGQNFGWPYIEGVDRINSTVHPNLIPAVWKQPLFEYPHKDIYDPRVRINNQYYTPSNAPFSFSRFRGYSVTGLDFNAGSYYPEIYKNAFFIGDYAGRFMRTLKLDASLNPVSIETIWDLPEDQQNLRPVCVVYNPNDQKMYFIDHQMGALKRLDYASMANLNPVSVFKMSKVNGKAPVSVEFNAFQSYDNENEVLTYSWDFGDGSTATGKVVTHTYISSLAQNRNVTLTVTDEHNNSNTSAQTFYLNNTPPYILNTTIDNLDRITPTQNLNVLLNSSFGDEDQLYSGLTHSWTYGLQHNSHFHASGGTFQNNQTLNLAALPCDGELYFYKLSLNVIDNRTQKTTFNKYVYPRCNPLIASIPEPVVIKVQNLHDKTFEVIWENSNTSNDIYSYEVYIDGDMKRFVNANTLSYTYVSFNSFVIGQVFNIEIRCTNKGGNSVSSYLKYTLQNQFCTTSNCLAPPTFNITSFSNNNGILAVSWANTLNQSNLIYDVYLNEILQTSTSSLNTSFTSILNPTNKIWIQARDNSYNTTATKPVVFKGCRSNHEIPNAKIVLDYYDFSKSKLKSNSEIIEGKKVYFESNGFIELNPGFKAVNGALFKAEIKNCNY